MFDKFNNFVLNLCALMGVLLIGCIFFCILENCNNIREIECSKTHTSIGIISEDCDCNHSFKEFEEKSVKYCSNCGELIDKSNCPECKQSIEENDKFCSGCGNDLKTLHNNKKE